MKNQQIGMGKPWNGAPGPGDPHRASDGARNAVQVQGDLEGRSRYQYHGVLIVKGRVWCSAFVAELYKILHDLVGLVIGIEADKNLVVVHFKNSLKNILFNLGGVTAGYLQWIDEFAIRKWEHSHFLIAR